MTTDNKIELTDALAFYFKNKRNMHAIDQIINNKGNPPDDFTVDELESFYVSKLNALQIQTDFWRFMKELWDKTWGVALKETPIDRTEQELSEYLEDGKNEMFLQNVWDNESFYRCFSSDNKELLFACEHKDNGKFILSFYVEEDSSYISNKLDLSNDWLQQPVKHYYRDSVSICTINSDGISGIEQLLESAKEAVKSIKEKLG
ncbi:MAG: hypothetical protein KAJ75_02775 [Alphaproteobacteria bacterium]|nr:hypothetical protein [Alphaproteobacteria bacterium]